MKIQYCELYYVQIIEILHKVSEKFSFNYRIIRKDKLLRISNEVLQRHLSHIKFTKVQYSKMCYKDESKLKIKT